jgi:hypothetical protein
MHESHLRLCLMLYSLQNELVDILNAIEAGEMSSDQASETARSALNRTLGALSRSVGA